MSFKPEVQADSTGTWAGNALRFATQEEARAYALDLAWRWTAVRETRVIEDEAPADYRWDFEKGELCRRSIDLGENG